MSGTLTLGTFLWLYWWERRRPLQAVEPTPARIGRDLMMAGITAMALQVTERSLISRFTRLVTQRRIGFLK